MQKIALQAAGVIFLVVSILHLLRVIFKVPLQIGQIQVSLEASLTGFLVTLLLSVWMFVSSKK